MNIRKQGLFIAVILTLAIAMVITSGNAWAAVVYLGDGAVQQADGTWALPTQGWCFAGNVTPIPTDRPGCLALRFPKVCTVASVGKACNTNADCTGGGTCSNATTQTICEGGSDPNKLAWATSACDLPGFDGNSGGCLGFGGTYSNGKCSLSMEDDSRNIATCNQLGGTWNTAGVCGGKWFPPNPGNLLNKTATEYGASTGDQCLRCHNLATQYNGTDVRWVGEWYMKMGHMNMARKVAPVCSISGKCSNATYLDSSSCQAAAATWTATTTATCVAQGGTLSYRPWAGPAGVKYPADDGGNIFTWTNTPPTVKISGLDKTLYWIYGDWLAPLPRDIYSADPVAGKPGVSYSCARCHTTGWTSDLTRNDSKEPEKTFFPLLGSHITWDGTAGDAVTGKVNLAGGVTGDNNKMASWDQFGIKCSRCHISVVDDARAACTLTQAICDANQTICETSTSANPGPPGCGGRYVAGVCKKTDLSGNIGSPKPVTDLATCTTLGGVLATPAPPFTAPLGMGTHNGGNTSADAGSGYCSDSRYTAQFQCEAAGFTWNTNCNLAIGSTPAVCAMSPAGYCSNSTYTDPVNCALNSATWNVVGAADCRGFCSDPTKTTQAACVGPAVWTPATWTASAAGWCSNTSYTDQPSCTNNGFAWLTGWCSVPSATIASCAFPDTAWCTDSTYSTKATCQTNGKGWVAGSWNIAGSQASCQVAGGTAALGTCSIPAICSKPGNSNYLACKGAGGVWTSLTSEYTCISAGGTYTGTKKYRGQIITTLCMDCHRQETGGLPYDSTNPATALKVGPAHNTVGFLSHPHGNEFLNSAHGQFNGTFAQIATKTKGDNPGYASDFMDWGEARNTGNGCTGCHNPHKSTVEEANPSGEFTVECTECHFNPARPSIPQIDVTKVNHLAGAGTPLEEMNTNPSEACESCHMPDAMHLWRINTDASYSTFPAGALAGTVDANTAPEGAYTKAVWVDIDAACGQCHGGGTAQANTTGAIAAASKVLTVTSSTGFTAGSKVRIAGAGALQEDGATRNDLDTYVLTIDTPTQITLAGAAIGGVAGAAVEQNATKNGAPYRTKANLAAAAKGMHSSAGVSYPVTFVYTKSGLTVNATAQVDCGGGACPTFTYDWSWGDGLSDLAVVTASKSHTYLTAGKKTITLTVNLNGLAVGSATRSLTLTAPDLAPVANANCTVLPAGWNANTWTMTIIDASTDTDSTPVQTIAVDWGDGSSKSIGVQNGTFAHTYKNAGTYTVTDKAIDTALKYSVFTCVPSPVAVTFTIGGTVKNKLGTANLASALVVLLKNGSPVKTAYTAADGTFSFTALKPATYTLKVTKTGYTFANPAATKTVGPDQTGFIINATAP